MDSVDYREKYKHLKRKFKGLQTVTSKQEHIKLSSQFEIASKSIRTLKREISFMEEKVTEIHKKSSKPQKKAKTDEQEEPQA
jgi:predicted  nucleic acid-binding Zn-ribbon protein